MRMKDGKPHVSINIQNIRIIPFLVFPLYFDISSFSRNISSKKAKPRLEHVYLCHCRGGPYSWPASYFLCPPLSLSVVVVECFLAGLCLLTSLACFSLPPRLRTTKNRCQGIFPLPCKPQLMVDKRWYSNIPLPAAKFPRVLECVQQNWALVASLYVFFVPCLTFFPLSLVLPVVTY